MPDDPDDLHSRLDPPDMPNTMPMEAAPPTPPLPRPAVPRPDFDEGPGTLQVPGADVPSGTFKAAAPVQPKSAPTPPPMPPAAPPTPRVNQKVVITAEVEEPIRRGKGLLTILLGLLQFMFGVFLIGLLLASIAPMMAGYDGPVGEVGARIQDYVRPYVLNICEAMPVSGCFGYGDPPPDTEPESSD